MVHLASPGMRFAIIKARENAMFKSILLTGIFVIGSLYAEANNVQKWADKRVNQHMVKTGTRIYHQKQNAELLRKKIQLESQVEGLRIKKDRNDIHGLQMKEQSYGLSDTQEAYYLENSPVDEVNGLTQEFIAQQEQNYQQQREREAMLEQLRNLMEKRKAREGLNYVLDEENMILRVEHD
jgi:hypothetical protein